MELLVALSIVFVTIILTYAYSYFTKKKENQVKIPFLKFNDIHYPVVNIRINDKDYSFLVDTGSTVSYINANVLSEIPHKLKSMNKEIEVEMFSSMSLSVDKEAEVSFYFGEHLYKKFPFTTIDFKDSFIFEEENFGVKINGILGNDFLSCFNYIIDYEQLYIYKV